MALETVVVVAAAMVEAKVKGVQRAALLEVTAVTSGSGRWEAKVAREAGSADEEGAAEATQGLVAFDKTLRTNRPGVPAWWEAITQARPEAW